MNASFNLAADDYDRSFTNSFIGRSQRDIVWKYLQKNLKKKSLNILEINCGTGEDAIFLAKHGHRVFATDASDKMIEVAKNKQLMIDENINVLFNVMDIKEIHLLNEHFDLIFSNFGGLNCLSPEEIKQLSIYASKLLNHGGQFIAVVMPSFCAWESFYFLIKGHFSKIFRRASKTPLSVMVDGSNVLTWYYSPSSFKALVTSHFLFIKQEPIGVMIPPSYLEPFIKKSTFLQRFLLFFENKLSGISFFASLSDHFLIEFQKK